MTRLLLLPLLALAACGPASPARSPEAAFAAHLEAVERRDAEAAYALLAEAADGGHLDALARQIEVHRRGYVRSTTGPDATNLPVRTPLWRTGAIERRYARAVRDSAAAGTPGGLLHAALGLAGDLITLGGETVSEMDPADRDSLEALYRRLVPMDVPRQPLAVLAWHLGLDDERAARLDEAVAAGERGACSVRIWFTGDPPDLRTTAGFAAYVDRVLACDPGPQGVEAMAREVRTLADQGAAGNEAAVVALDSLHRLGVFERHPPLAEAVAGL